MRTIMMFLLLLTLIQSRAETLTVGTPPFSPPFVMTADNNNHLIGFSIDIMSTVCKRLQVTCVYKTSSIDETFSDVIDHKVDLAIGSFTITPEREKEVLFSLPYLQSQAAFVTLATSQVTAIDALRGKTIGAEKGSVFIDYLTKKFGNDVKIVSYPVIADLMFALNEGNIDAVIFDKETAYFWMGNNYDMFKLVGAPFPLGIGIGIMTNKDNQALMNRINQTLVRMETEGSYLKIYNTYFGDMTKVNSPLY